MASRLEKGIEFALSDDAQLIFEKEGKEGLIKAIKKKGISKKAKGGKVRAFKNGGAVMNGRGPKFKGQT